MALAIMEEMTTGITELDHDHRELLAHIDDLLEGWERGEEKDARAALEFILRHVVWHFDHEEEQMWALGYPRTHQHMAQHERLRTYAESLKEQLETHGPDPEMSDVTSRLLANRLTAHIRSADKEFARFVETRDLA